MDNYHQSQTRDDSTDSIEDSWYGSSMGPLAFTFSVILLFAAICSLTLLYLRRKRLARQQAALPMHHSMHHRSASITHFAANQNDAVYVYDDKMNLIANTPGRASRVPEIHITFPDEENSAGARQTGRVVVVHVTDSGSVGMGPLQQENLPPYQRSDAERFQSLDLERMGGLREKETPTQQQRWS